MANLSDRTSRPRLILMAALACAAPACGDDGAGTGGDDGGGGGANPGAGGATQATGAGAEGGGGEAQGGGGEAQGGGGEAQGGGGGAAEDFTLWTQSVDAGTTLGESNDDFADQARETLFDAASGRRYVIGYGLIEGSSDPDKTFVSYVRAYDGASGEVVDQLRVGPTSSGKETRLFNGVIGSEGGTDYLYVSGKTNSNIANICPGGLELPAAGTGPSMSGVLLQIDLGTLDIVDCLAIQSAGDRFDEISTLEWDDVNDVLWIAGSTKGDLAPGSRVVGNPVGGSESSSDFYAARVSPSLDQLPLFIQFGSSDFDETLGSHFDSATQTMFVAGSTKGDLCAAYPAQSTGMGITCAHGQGGAFGDNFDTYFAAITFSAPSTLTHRWVYQEGEGNGNGAEDADVPHDVELYTNADGVQYLYETGYAPGGAAADVRVSRITLDSDGNPLVTDGVVERARTNVADPAGFGDSGSTLFVGATRLWLTATMHGGADHAHGGPCGEGETSSNEGHLLGFAHDTFADDVAPDVDLVRAVTTGNPNQRSTSFEGLSYSEGKFWISGNTTAAPGTGYCGTQTTKDVDDESDAVIFHVEIADR